MCVRVCAPRLLLHQLAQVSADIPSLPGKTLARERQAKVIEKRKQKKSSEKIVQKIKKKRKALNAKRTINLARSTEQSFFRSVVYKKKKMCFSLMELES